MTKKQAAESAKTAQPEQPASEQTVDASFTEVDAADKKQ